MTEEQYTEYLAELDAAEDDRDLVDLLADGPGEGS